MHGGQIIAQGTIEELKQNPHSVTGQYLNGNKRIAIPKIKRRIDSEKQITIIGAEENT